MPVPSIAAELLATYRDFATSVVTDGMGRLGAGAWMDGVHAIQPGRRLSGRVRTLQFGPRSGVRHSTESIYSFAEKLLPGDIIVVGAGGTQGWLFGENIAQFCVNCGAGGIVTDGRVRDVEQLQDVDMPIFARGATARPFKGHVEVVSTDVPLDCGGAYIVPGDLILGDRDGIVVVPNAVVAPLVAEVRDIVELERLQGEAIAAGKSLREIRAIADLKTTRRAAAPA